MEFACEAIHSGLDIIKQDGHVDMDLLTEVDVERTTRNATCIKPGPAANR